MATYCQDTSERLWWCNSHGRRATHILSRWNGEEKHCCNPALGGILIPCACVDLTDQVEFVG